MSALSNSSSVLTWFCHWICRILRRHLLWNTSTDLSSSSFIFHVSHLYSRTGTTSVLYSLSFVLLKMFFECQILFNLTNALLTFESPFFRSSWHLPLYNYKLYKCSSQVSELMYFICYSLSSYSVSWSYDFLALTLITFVFFMLNEKIAVRPLCWIHKSKYMGWREATTIRKYIS